MAVALHNRNLTRYGFHAIASSNSAFAEVPTPVYGPAWNKSIGLKPQQARHRLQR